MAFIELFNAVYYQDRVAYEIPVRNYDRVFNKYQCTRAIANELIYAIKPELRTSIEKIKINNDCTADVFIRDCDFVLIFEARMTGVKYSHDRKRGVLE